MCIDYRASTIGAAHLLTYLGNIHSSGRHLGRAKKKLVLALILPLSGGIDDIWRAVIDKRTIITRIGPMLSKST